MERSNQPEVTCALAAERYNLDAASATRGEHLRHHQNQNQKPTTLFTVTVGRRASSATHYIPEHSGSMLDLMQRMLKSEKDDARLKFHKIKSVPNMQQTGGSSRFI
eukprot:g7808.t1